MYRCLTTTARRFSRQTMDAAKTPPPGAKKKFGNTETLRHVKHKQKLQGKLPVSGVISLQVCGTGGYDCPRSIVLSTDHNKYLFNCGEGTQRLINEHKMKASRLEHIFITHQSWENVGGLLGMALTLQAVNVPLITIHGPPGVEKGVHMSRNFADTKAAGVKKMGLDGEPFSDHTFSIEAVPLKAEKTNSEAKRARVDYEKDLAVAYICRPHLYPRKVDLAKCVELGIKSGPILGKLKAGETVTLDDGREILPDQILGDQLPSKPILFVELPNEKYLDSLLNSEPIGKLQCFTENGSAYEETDISSSEQEAELVVHLSEMKILNHERYRYWMQKFSPSTRHLLFDPKSCGPSFKNPYRCQTMLNQLHDKIFPLLDVQIQEQEWTENLEENIVKVTSNLVYNYRPRKQFHTDGVTVLNKEEYLAESHAQPEFTDQLKEVKTKLAGISGAYDNCTYPNVVFLGTGSSVPSNTRNVSSILLHVSEDSCLLLDCGEGTFGQLYRFYGNETENVLKKVRGILVSHLHADHQLGVFTFILERHKLYSAESWYRPLDIIGPANYKNWANTFLSEFIPVDQCMQHFENHTFLSDYLDTTNDEYVELLGRLELDYLESVSVRHCKGSFGFVMKLRDGKKVTYSGDTMPCENLVKAGRNSDLLIHEATMENDLVEEARRKTHSTTSEAIEVGRKMNAKFTLLTHFSQRYAKIPVFGDEFTENVGIAFDNMRVDFEQLKLLPLFTPALKALFAEHYAELEANIEKRQVRARALEIAAKSIAEAQENEKVESMKS